MRYLTQVCVGAMAALASLATTQAADLRAPVSRAPAMNWTGWYVGASAGYGWSNSHVDPFTGVAFCNTDLGGCTNGPAFANAQALSVPPALFTHPTGALLGGHLGYNYQWDSFVAGVETDISWTNINGSNTQSGAQLVADPIFVNTTSISATALAEQHLRFFGTLRARLGYLPADTLLLFVTGGLAYGQVQTTTSVNEVILGGCFCSPITPSVGSLTTTKAGWTAGFGLEYAFSRPWSFKAEYLYFSFGGMTYAQTPLTLANGAGVPFTAVSVGTNTSFAASVIRLGLNYKINN
jgi:outer membrane immunogenic protein